MAKKKPETEEQKLLATLLLRMISPLNPLPVQIAEGIYLIRPENIAYIQTANREVEIHTLDGKVWRRFDSLTKMEEKLKGDPRFFRSHRSFLVNLYQIEKMSKKGGSQTWNLHFPGKVAETADLAVSKKSEFDRLMGL